jgi:hypothetical protein
MKTNPYPPKVTPENKKIKSKSGDATKIVQFKKKTFQFKVSTMEEKKGIFNQEISFLNPNKGEMYLFVGKISWDQSITLIDAIIQILVTYPGGQTEKIYNSKITTQSVEGRRNINLTYSIKEAAEIKVIFECKGLDEPNPNYSIVYKWLDPQPVKNSKGNILL